MAIKIGKWYITRNNPRELLLQLRYKQDIIDELEEWLKSERNKTKSMREYEYPCGRDDMAWDILDKMEEIKEKYNV